MISQSTSERGERERERKIEKKLLKYFCLYIIAHITKQEVIIIFFFELNESARFADNYYRDILILIFFVIQTI
jgi:hypothetical protein